jgi:hypothetical protein
MSHTYADACCCSGCTSMRHPDVVAELGRFLLERDDWMRHALDRAAELDKSRARLDATLLDLADVSARLAETSTLRDDLARVTKERDATAAARDEAYVRVAEEHNRAERANAARIAALTTLLRLYQATEDECGGFFLSDPGPWGEARDEAWRVLATATKEVGGG